MLSKIFATREQILHIIVLMYFSFLKSYHQDCTFFISIKSKFNLGGITGLVQAVCLDTQALIKKFPFFIKIWEIYF